MKNCQEHLEQMHLKTAANTAGYSLLANYSHVAVVADVAFAAVFARLALADTGMSDATLVEFYHS